MSLTEQLQVQEKEYTEHRSKLEELEGQITQLVSKMQTIETKNSKHK
jgi:phage shock protein A